MKAPIAAPAAAAPRFDVNALGEFAGEQVFVRGELRPKVGDGVNR